MLTSHRQKLAIALVFLFCLLGGAAFAEAHRTMVRAHGQAVIEKGNAQAAEALAAAVAYRRAVEEVALSLGGPKPGKDTLIDQLLYERAATFVTNSVLVTRRASGTLLNLEFEVEVEVDAVQTVLQQRMRPARPSRAALPGAAWVLRLPVSTRSVL